MRSDKTDFVPRRPKGVVATADKKYKELYKKVKHLLRPDFYVVNIGANDGVDNDPIHPFLMMYPNWRGVLIEPVPHNFLQLKHNYASYPNIELENSAITLTPKPFYYLAENDTCDMRWVSQISSFDKNHIMTSLEGIRKLAPHNTVSVDAEKYIVEDTSINCITLDELIKKYDIERIDFLNIDAEGHDFEIFQAFDFDSFTPKIICIETADFSPQEHELFEKKMEKFNYQRVAKFEVFSDIFILRGPLRTNADTGNDSISSKNANVFRRMLSKLARIIPLP